MKLAIVRGATGIQHEQYLNVGEEAWQHYCRLHGHTYVVFRGDWVTRPPAWNKIPWLLSIMGGLYGGDGLIWCDADTLLVDLKSDLTKMIPASGLAMGWYEHPYKHFCSGVIAMRCGELSRDYLQAVWDAGPMPAGFGEIPWGYDQPGFNKLADEFRLSTLDPRWHSIHVVDPSLNGVIIGFHGELNRMDHMVNVEKWRKSKR